MKLKGVARPKESNQAINDKNFEEAETLNEQRKLVRKVKNKINVSFILKMVPVIQQPLVPTSSFSV